MSINNKLLLLFLPIFNFYSILAYKDYLNLKKDINIRLDPRRIATIERTVLWPPGTELFTFIARLQNNTVVYIRQNTNMVVWEGCSKKAAREKIEIKKGKMGKGKRKRWSKCTIHTPELINMLTLSITTIKMVPWNIWNFIPNFSL